LPETSEVVADLGSGHDYALLRYLSRTGRAKQGIAVDLTLDSVQKMPSIRLLEADLGHPLPIDDASVDVVLSVAVIEHLDDPLLHLREACRVLRPLGRVVLTSPAQSSQRLLEFLAFRVHVIDEREIRDHRRYYSEADVRELLLDAGFDARTVGYQRFLLGLNQLAFATKGTQSG
jgi:SAM-dependent methyltransferase